MKLTCDIKATDFSDDEIFECTVSAVESYLNKKTDILFNIPTTDIIHQIAENFARAVIRGLIFDLGDVKVKSHKLDDVETVEANMIKALKKKLNESLVYVHFEILYKNMWPNLNIKAEIKEIQNSGKYVILYQSDEWVCYVSASPLIFK